MNNQPVMMHNIHPEVANLIFGTTSFEKEDAFYTKKLNRSQQTNLIGAYKVFGLNTIKKDRVHTIGICLEKGLAALCMIGVCWAIFYFVDSEFHTIAFISLLALLVSYFFGVLQLKIMSYCARLNAMTALYVTENIQSAVRMGKEEYASYVNEKSPFDWKEGELTEEESTKRCIAIATINMLGN